jgi:hypothetical protein
MTTTVNYEYPGYLPAIGPEAVAHLRPGLAQFWLWFANTENQFLYQDLQWLGSPNEKPTEEEVNTWLEAENLSRSRDWGGLMSGMVREPLLLQKWQKCMTSTVRVNGLLTMIFLSGMFWRTHDTFVFMLKDFRQAIANSSTAGGDFTTEELECIKDWLTQCKFDPAIIDFPAS